MLIIMYPLVLLKINFPSPTPIVHPYAPQALLVNIKMHFGVDIRKELPFGHKIRDNSIVKLLADSLQLQEVLDHEKFSYHLHAVFGP